MEVSHATYRSEGERLAQLARLFEVLEPDTNLHAGLVRAASKERTSYRPYCDDGNGLLRCSTCPYRMCLSEEYLNVASEYNLNRFDTINEDIQVLLRKISTEISLRGLD